MILSFNKQFKTPIIKTLVDMVRTHELICVWIKNHLKESWKIHTIRDDKPNRWKAGNIIHFVTGNRTPQYDNFATDKCSGIEKIVFKLVDNILTVRIGYCELDRKQINVLARLDGFNDIEAFERWFVPLCFESENQTYEAKIIHWTEFRYTKWITDTMKPPIPQFANCEFNNIKAFNTWLNTHTYKVIRLYDNGQDLLSLHIHQSGEILEASGQQRPWTGMFVDLNRLENGKPIWMYQIYGPKKGWTEMDFIAETIETPLKTKK